MSTQPVVVQRPRPVTLRVIPARPVAVRRPRQILPRARANPTRPGAVRRPRSVTPRPLVGRQRPTRPATDALDRLREAEQERERRHQSQELADRSFFVPRSEDRETREDRERERTSEDSPDSPRRRACCDERGEATEEADRAGDVCCERATSASPAPEEAEACGRATRDTSTPLAGPRSSRRRGSLTGRSTRCILRLPPS